MTCEHKLTWRPSEGLAEMSTMQAWIICRLLFYTTLGKSRKESFFSVERIIERRKTGNVSISSTFFKVCFALQPSITTISAMQVLSWVLKWQLQLSYFYFIRVGSIWLNGLGGHSMNVAGNLLIIWLQRFRGKCFRLFISLFICLTLVFWLSLV